MSQPNPPTSPPHRKLPGWVAPAIVVLAIGGVSWFAWQQFGGGGAPAVGERIELAPGPEVRPGNRGFAESAARALSNLGRNRRAASQPATSKS